MMRAGAVRAAFFAVPLAALFVFPAGPRTALAQSGEPIPIATEDLSWAFPVGERMVFSGMYGRVRVGEG